MILGIMQHCPQRMLFLHHRLLGDKMNALGRLNVDEFLQVKDMPDVYAIGDCNDLPEIKLAYGAETQGKYVADQLKLKHEGKAMTPYNVNSTFPLIFVCLVIYLLLYMHSTVQSQCKQMNSISLKSTVRTILVEI